MEKIILLIVVLCLTSCGEVAGMNDCDGVDTSQAPDNIINNATETTYVWGSCRKTYYK